MTQRKPPVRMQRVDGQRQLPMADRLLEKTLLLLPAPLDRHTAWLVRSPGRLQDSSAAEAKHSARPMDALHSDIGRMIHGKLMQCLMIASPGSQGPLRPHVLAPRRLPRPLVERQVARDVAQSAQQPRAVWPLLEPLSHHGLCRMRFAQHPARLTQPRLSRRARHFARAQLREQFECQHSQIPALLPAPMPA